MVTSDFPGSPGLLELPSEVKLMIYRYVFNDIPSKLGPFDDYLWRKTPRPSLAILGACRQLRTEALPVIKSIFRKTTLVLDGAESEPPMLQTFGEDFTEAFITVHDTNEGSATSMLPNLKRLVIDYTGNWELFEIPYDGDSKEYWESDGGLEILVHEWKSKGRQVDPKGDHWKRLMHDIPDDYPHFKVEVLVYFDVLADFDDDLLVRWLFLQLDRCLHLRLVFAHRCCNQHGGEEMVGTT